MVGCTCDLPPGSAKHALAPPQINAQQHRRSAGGQLPALPLVPALIEIFDCLKKYGQRLDLEIAKETGVPLAKVRQRLAELAATGDIITCNLTRFEHGKRIDALLCRISGWVPPPAPGRKAKLPGVVN
jgi:hypothetical protein